MALLVLLAVVGGLEFSGQATAGLTACYRRDWLGMLAAAEYRPQVRLTLAAFDAELSARGAAGLESRLFDSTRHDLDLGLYRAFLRGGTRHCEVRAGLQQLNFGSAMMLRPLRWFDRLDPRDPLPTTEGVYGLLGRGFLGNSNAWAWGLIGNERLKGMEAVPTPRWFPEAGGRVELALPRGEAAASCHFRRAILPALPGFDTVGEQRLGLDARWDLGIGIWTEAALSRFAAPGHDRWNRLAMLGADYTLGIGSGLSLVAEHMVSGAGPTAFSADSWPQVSALSVACPVSITDNLQAFILFDWSARRPYSHLGWRRTRDNWVLLVAGFWNPDQASAAGAAGKGVSLTVVFNH